MEQNLIMLQGLSCLFISAKNYEMDPTVPSSRKFLRQLPGYVPTQKEQNYENQAYGVNALSGANREQKFDAKKNELCEQEQYILNLIKFDLDTFPLFYDIVEIMMAQGVIYSSDCLKNGQKIAQDVNQVNLLEKYIDFFSLLSL